MSKLGEHSQSSRESSPNLINVPLSLKKLFPKLGAFSNSEGINLKTLPNIQGKHL